MKSTITPFTEPLLNLFYQALSDPDPEVRSNAAFACGNLVEHSERDLSPQFLPILGALRPLFEVVPGDSATQLNARDNAAGAVARLILRNSDVVPLGQVLPVLIDSLPLKDDKEENRPVFKALFHLFRTNPASVSPYIDRLLQVFAQVLDPSGAELVSDEIRAELIALITALNGQDPGKVQAAGLAIFVQG